MKKKRFNKKLSLNKETISNLNEIKGGGAKDCNTDGANSCTPTHNNCPIKVTNKPYNSGCICS